LALLTPPADPRNAEALARLQEINAPPVALRLVLAWIHLNRFQWAEARAELEQAARQAPRNQRVWEMLASLAQIRMDRKLRASSMAALQACNPRHPMLRVPAASDQFRSGRKAEAQAGLEDGLRLGRDPEVLHALAYIAMARQGDPAQIRAWLDEAIQKLPYHPMFRATRGELNLQEGHLDAAQRDLKLALAALPEMLPVRLLVVQLLAASGETEKARALAKVLSSRWSDFSPSQQQTLQHLLQGAAPHE
jgi:Tfp pilus assembly protein PilF